MTVNYERPSAGALAKRLREPRRLIQVVGGARQVGKTTLVGQAVEHSGLPYRLASADEPTLETDGWLQHHWVEARRLASEAGPGGAVLVLDEVQKVPRWSERVKHLWDADSRTGVPLHVVLTGSVPLLMDPGMRESLMGRFEQLKIPHWSFEEMRTAFGWSLDDFIQYGGYPGSAHLISDPPRWANYIRDAILEPVISRDVLLFSRITKPALFRQTVDLACQYSGQILSYTKMVGQLQDAGNTVTVARYLNLLSDAAIVTGLQKHANQKIGRRASIPKLQVFNNALLGAQNGTALPQIRRNPAAWGRLVESAVGTHLANATIDDEIKVRYWREGDREVDFVASRDEQVVAIEVKSGRRFRSLLDFSSVTGRDVVAYEEKRSARRSPLRGLAAFGRRHPDARLLLVGEGGIPIEEFLSTPVSRWFEP